MIKSRFGNYGLWSSIFALIFLVCEGYGVTNILPANYQDIVTTILSIMVFAGLISDPTTNTKWFLDDKAEE